MNHAKKIQLLFLLLFCVKTMRAQVVVDTFNLPSGYTNIQLGARNTLKVDHSNNVWIGFQRMGAGKFDGSNWTVYDTSNGLPSLNATSFAFSNSDSWIGTDSGLAKLNGSTWTIYNSQNSGLTTNYIQSLFWDGNNLWVGTKSGAFIFDGTLWTHFTTSNSGLASDTVNCFTKTGNDTIWIGTANGLSKYYNGNWTTYYVPDFSSLYNPIGKIAPDLSGNIWMQAGPPFVKIFVLYQDSVCSFSRFYSFCTSTPQYGLILGRTSYGNVAMFGESGYGNFFEFNSDPLSGSSINIPLVPLTLTGYEDVDSSNNVWFTRNTDKLRRINYHSGLQPLSEVNDCYTLDINQVRARIENNGSMFWDLIGNAEYEVPKGTGKNSVFADGFWIGGMDASNQLHLAAQTYRQSGSDFWPGPLDTTTISIDLNSIARYDSIWKIDRSTIEEFNTEFNHGNVSNHTYTVPDIILNWPTQGAGNFSRNLAPFVDNNHDGIYNPYDGDYPDILGDQELWWVFNDHFGRHNETFGGTPFGIEIQVSAYAYSCPNIPDSEEVINYTTFYHYKIINRSDTNYYQVYMGRFTDPDLGNYLDDLVGCDSVVGFAYVYNGDNFDEGITGYGYNPPVQNLIYLNNTMTHFQYYDNNNDSVNGNPEYPMEYYNYLRSFWKDSSHVTYGGNGYGGGIGATNIPANFMYPSSPYDASPNAWNEVSAGNTPDDRRFVTSTGPFDFPAHSTKEFDFAYVWSRDATEPNGPTTSWAKNVHDVLKIKEWYANNSFPCRNSLVGIHELTGNTIGVNIFPNPATHQLTISINDKKNSVYKMEMTDVTGRIIRNGIVFSNRNNTVDLDEIVSGIYFIKISDKDFVTVKKFIRE